MSSVVDSKAETEKKRILAISIVAYSFLYIFTVAMFYLSWLSFIIKDLLHLTVYLAFYSIFLVAHFWVVRDIYSNYDYFVQEENKAGIDLIAKTHFLCANPLCPRCGGWYFGLGTSFTIMAIFFASLRDFLAAHPYSPYVFVTLGAIMFGLSTPVHGSLNFLRGFDKKILENNKLKLFCGFVSGLSLVLIAVGIIVMIS